MPGKLLLDESYRDVLTRHGLVPPDEPGSIVDTGGREIGRHSGIANYTVGQRRGLGISTPERLYVLRVEPETRRVVVARDDELYEDRCVLERVRWIPFDRPRGPIAATVRIRSNHSGAPAILRELGDGRTEVRFDDPQRAITPGQAAVAYDGDLVLGGGWIA